MKNILLVEDEKLIRHELTSMLKSAGYSLSIIEDFNNVSKQILHIKPDLIVLDLNLPFESGFEICKTVKRKSSIPILVLTSRDQLRDELYALKIGADEYLTKPFRKERLLARIENVLKRYNGMVNILEVDNISLDRNTYTLYTNGNSVVLPQNQGMLLEAFLTSKDYFVSKKDLSLKLWGTLEFIDENALQVNISRLKKSLKGYGLNYRIEAVRGKGYKLLRGDYDK